MTTEGKPDIPTPITNANINTNTAQRVQNPKIKPHGIVLVGKKVKTPFGSGVVTAYRYQDSIYEIQLPTQATATSRSVNTLYTREVPEKIQSKEDDAEALNVAYEALEKMRRLNLEMQCFDVGIIHVDHGHCTTCLLSNSIPTKRFPRLQQAYEGATVAQESAANNIAKIPKLFQWQQQQQGSDAATTRQQSLNQRNVFQKLPSRLFGNKNNDHKNNLPDTKENQSTPANHQMLDERKPAAKAGTPRVLPRIQNLLDNRLKQQSPSCLICASPSCPNHCSPSFRKDGITVCLNCERLFQLEFITTCVKEPDAQIRAKHIDHMIDLYDRCLLLLNYSSQYIEQIAVTLENTKEKQNKIGLGSSGVGVVSGVLGIAAAATILTPAGPPLLIASLVFGGSATTVQVGTEALNYFSEPNKLADRIIALHGMTLSILRVTSTLRDAMMRDYIRTDGICDEKGDLAQVVQERFEKHRSGVVAGVNAGSGVALGGVALTEAGALAAADAGAMAAQAARVASTEAGVLAGAGAGARGASVASRATTASSAAARGLRFARFAGGALSAAVLLMEANAMHHTLRDIQEGNPCEKAKIMRGILQELEASALPSSSALDEECQRYLEAMMSRPHIPEVDAEAAEGHEDDLPQAECIVASSEGMAAPGAIIVEGAGNQTTSDSLPLSSVVAEEASPSLTSSVMNGSSSLFQRIQMHQRQRREMEAARNDEVIAVIVESEEARRAQLNLL
ncbi:unnamed protein product [Cylindrotheca closterium]|uniref:Uncharacterized protein n=1 Tax=Cylindrotheca closterium TaxID=2856 RepID=A0AAD2CLN3_9STRA|nr:unnamed protein product [Cylindrotheca closterium]